MISLKGTRNPRKFQTALPNHNEWNLPPNHCSKSGLNNYFKFRIRLLKNAKFCDQLESNNYGTKEGAECEEANVEEEEEPAVKVKRKESKTKYSDVTNAFTKLDTVGI